MPPAILTKKVVRTFQKRKQDKVNALNGVDIEVNPGEIFGFLGPNGAGKTTLIKILCTLLYPSSGEAYVDGLDVVKDTQKVRRVISMVSGGESSGYGILTVAENIWMFSQFHGIPGRIVKERTARYMKAFDFEKDLHTKLSKLSTGMRQKMNLIRGFVTDPKIFFLDEPTLGLDPHVARNVRDNIQSWVADHKEKTVFLTTHYMAEAEELCDRIAIMDKGEIVVCDTPANLRKQVGGDSIYRLALSPQPAQMDFLAGILGVKSPWIFKAKNGDGDWEIRFGLEADEILLAVLQAAKDSGLKVESFGKIDPGLEDLFLKIVGRKLEKEE